MLLIHGWFVVVVIVLVLLGRARPGTVPETLIGAGLVNAVCIAIELLAVAPAAQGDRHRLGRAPPHAREQIRMRDELRYARELQMSMLPERAPQLEWLDLAGISLPATEVGGDYYDYFVDRRPRSRSSAATSPATAWPAASCSPRCAAASRCCAIRSIDPAAVLQRLHELVAQTSRRRMLVTVVGAAARSGSPPRHASPAPAIRR